MADIAENVPFTDPATAISQGRRHLLVRDYTMAVTALAQACELLAKKHDEKKSLNEDTLAKKNEKDEQNEKIKDKEDNMKTNNDENKEKTVIESENESTSKNETTTDDDTAAAATSAATSSKQQNGNLKENGEHSSEDISKEDEEDEVNNLQVAWEVLELAKLVLHKRGQPGWKLLAESYRLLGEVAMEGGNYKGALNDLQMSLDLFEKIDPREPRDIAEIHYQLGLAHSLGSEFDASIEEFNNAKKILESRVKELEAITEPPKTDDPFYTVEAEIQELKDLLPDIQEKITDMQDFKKEACKLVIENIKSGLSSCSSNGAGPSSDASNSSSSGNTTSPKAVKPVTDISHLVRKKRKSEETETETETDIPMPPCKKPTPEKAV
ncbi:hypothetical protein M0802_001137 [Mischocyttarus mexicanus]|nr:hypothetical protein M0802_001137 [Mischocyttarus mexicanus]